MLHHIRVLKTQHASEQTGTQASRTHTAQAGKCASQTARRREQRSVFCSRGCPTSACGNPGSMALWEYSLSRSVRRSCADSGRTGACSEKGRACGGRRSCVPEHASPTRNSTLRQAEDVGRAAGKLFQAQGEQPAARRGAGLDPKRRRHPSCPMFSQSLTG